MRHPLPALALFFAPAVVFAHGVQTQIIFSPSSGKIETRQIVATSNDVPCAHYAYGTAIAPAARVFVIPLLDSALPLGSGYYTRPTDVRSTLTGAPLHPSGPGLTYRFESQTPGSGWSHSGSSTLPNLSGTAFSYVFADALKLWNGSGWIDPGLEQLQIIRDGGTGTFTASTVHAVTSDAGPFASMPLNTIGATAPGATSIPHSSLAFRLLGDGVRSTAASDDGIYLATLKLTSTATVGTSGVPVGDSDPFYLVMYKNSSLANAAWAASAIATANGIPISQVQLAVPEPASMALLFCTTALAKRSRR